jgi:hypothetical protein
VEQGFSNYSYSVIATDVLIHSLKSSSLIVGQTGVTFDFDLNSLYRGSNRGYYNITFPNEVSATPPYGSVSCSTYQIGKGTNV